MKGDKAGLAMGFSQFLGSKKNMAPKRLGMKPPIQDAGDPPFVGDSGNRGSPWFKKLKGIPQKRSGGVKMFDQSGGEDQIEAGLAQGQLQNIAPNEMSLNINNFPLPVETTVSVNGNVITNDNFSLARVEHNPNTNSAILT
jgi:hypothetical protein